MKVKGPSSPLSSGAEPLDPLDPRELQKAVKGERFAAMLSQLESQVASSSSASSSSNSTRAALEEIANASTLTSSEGAATAVRESARYMIRSRLSKQFRDTEQAQNLVNDLGEYVANDPLLKSQLLSILQRIRTG